VTNVEVGDVSRIHLGIWDYYQDGVIFLGCVLFLMIYSLMGLGFECNCYFVVGKKAALIDAGDPKAAMDKSLELNMGINYLLTTHYHFDHVLGLLELKAKTGGLIAAHEADAVFLENGDKTRIMPHLFGSPFSKVHVDMRLAEGHIIDLGGLSLEVIHTPGHTPGSICFYEANSKSLFSGDTVFADGVGRTDFPGGSMGDLEKSVEKLLLLHEKRGIETIYPGHGPPACGNDLEAIYEEYF